MSVLSLAQEGWQGAAATWVVSGASGVGCSCLSSAQGSVWAHMSPLRERLRWVRALPGPPQGAVCLWPRPSCATWSPPVTVQGAGAAEIRLPKELGVSMGTAAHPACTPLCARTLLGAQGDGWMGDLNPEERHIPGAAVA